MAKECEICGRTIRGAGRKYCSYCRNSADVKNRTEEDCSLKNLKYYIGKRRLNWKPFIIILFISLVAVSFFILSNNGNNDLNILENSTNVTCQYKMQQGTGKVISYLQDDGGNKYYKITKVSDFYGQRYLPYTTSTCKTSFVIENLIDKDINFKIHYDILYYDSNKVLERMPQKLDLFLSKLSRKILSDSVGTGGYHNCNVDQNSIKISYRSNSQLELKTDKAYKEVCKKCDGKICFNDGKKCSSDSVCGSGICNIAGFCGTEKIVECPIGLQNCNNESCFEVGTKNVGEKYFCEFECKTNYGENGICSTSVKQKISEFILITIFLLIFSFIVYLVLGDKKLIEIVRWPKWT